MMGRKRKDCRSNMQHLSRYLFQIMASLAKWSGAMACGVWLSRIFSGKGGPTVKGLAVPAGPVNEVKASNVPGITPEELMIIFTPPGKSIQVQRRTPITYLPSQKFSRNFPTENEAQQIIEAAKNAAALKLAKEILAPPRRYYS